MNIEPLEMQFLMSFISHNHRVLEWGCGESTILIASKAKYVTSVEHNKKWYNRLIARKEREKINNLNLILAKPNKKWISSRDHDGTLDQFKDYVHSPINHGPFDVILIDGRARVACASFCHLLGHSGTQVFIHDYNHPDARDYSGALAYLEKTDEQDSLFRFKIKGCNFND